tara:strand:- start:18057 stop:19184 length:1128 start_codon:yes stop_codon:yes gene_type:complete
MDAMPNLKVIHVASGDLWGGAEAQLLTLAKQLQARDNVEVTVVLLNYGQLETRLAEHKIPTIVFDEQKMGFLSILVGLAKLFNVKRPQVIHSHRQKENILSSLANVLSVRAKCVRTQHGAPEFQYSWRQLHKKIQQRLDNFCGRFLQSKVIAVSDELAEKLKTSFPSTHIEVVENGVDQELLKSSCVIAPFKREQPTAKHVGIVGRLVPVKRIDLFLAMVQAFVADEAQDSNVQFHIIGDGPLRVELEQQAKSLSISNRVTFHGHINNIADYIFSLDILVMCSDHEGLPMTLLEAMTLGTAIISYNAGALTPYFARECGGVLSSAHSSEAYSESLKKLLSNDEGRNAIILAGQKAVSETFSANTNAEKILKVYQS